VWSYVYSGQGNAWSHGLRDDKAMAAPKKVAECKKASQVGQAAGRRLSVVAVLPPQDHSHLLCIGQLSSKLAKPLQQQLLQPAPAYLMPWCTCTCNVRPPTAHICLTTNTNTNTLQARPHGKTRHLVLTPNSRYVWSIGTNNICLWDCYKHSYLGTLDKEAVATTSADFYREGEPVPEAWY
jgi:hypothetical protein